MLFTLIRCHCQRGQDASGHREIIITIIMIEHRYGKLSTDTRCTGLSEKASEHLLVIVAYADDLNDSVLAEYDYLL